MSSIKVALEQAEAEKQRRLDEKIARNEAMRTFVVVGGHQDIAAAKDRKIAELRAAGEQREIYFGVQFEGDEKPIEAICTGVPRFRRDDVYAAYLEAEAARPGYKPPTNEGPKKPTEVKPPPMSVPTPEPTLPTDWSAV